MSDPKLLDASRRIKAILTELDVAGHVVLHNAPGKFEIITAIEPSYSILRGLPPEIRILSKLADYKGDAEAQHRDQEATASMVRGFGEIMGQNALWLLELAEAIDKITGAEHTPLESDQEPTP